MPKKKFGQVHKILFDPMSILILVSILDLIATSIYVYKSFRSLLADGLTPAHFFGFYLINPSLLLVAAVGAQTKNKWGYCIAIMASSWLVKRILQLWTMVATSNEQPLFSWSTFHEWRFTGFPGKFDLVRLILATTIFLYGSFRLVRNLLRKADVEL